MQSDHSISFL